VKAGPVFSFEIDFIFSSQFVAANQIVAKPIKSAPLKSAIVINEPDHSVAVENMVYFLVLACDIHCRKLVPVIASY
jgi:hypothetical protein